MYIRMSHMALCCMYVCLILHCVVRTYVLYCTVLYVRMPYIALYLCCRSEEDPLHGKGNALHRIVMFCGHQINCLPELLCEVQGLQ